MSNENEKNVARDFMIGVFLGKDRDFHALPVRCPPSSYDGGDSIFPALRSLAVRAPSFKKMTADFSSRGGKARFPPTRRSAVIAIGSADSKERAHSFDVLVRAYWRPVYAHVRFKWRRTADDARDVTQAFFARAFEKRYFINYDPAKAHFRTYLKACLDRFVAETARDEHRLKRGGRAMRLSLDFDLAEEELARVHHETSEAREGSFDAEWTRSVLGSALDALRETCAEKKKDNYFRVLQRYAIDGEERKPSYAIVAEELGISVSDVTNYLAWSRRELRKIVLEKLREITASEEEFRSEARALLGEGG
jgi:RNA polymerase sigma factor (sigma-70 family)